MMKEKKQLLIIKLLKKIKEENRRKFIKKNKAKLIVGLFSLLLLHAVINSMLIPTTITVNIFFIVYKY